jgi:outer membrane immunogenic protein
MRLTIAAAVAASAFALTADRAVAADMPAKAPPPVMAPAPYNWSGFYAGVHAGYGWADGKTDIGIDDPTGVTQIFAAAGAFPLSYSFSRDGYVAGGQIGFNYVVNQWLWGVEADFSATGMDGSATVFTPTCPICTLPTLSSVSQDMDWFGTVRGRVGYVSGPWLLYGTGGLAYGHVNYSYLQTNVPYGGALTIAASDSATEVGWTAGAGVEYGWGAWSAKLEYLYYDLGDRSFSAIHPLAPVVVQLVPNFQNTGSIVRAGLNYRFW